MIGRITFRKVIEFLIIVLASAVLGLLVARWAP